LKFGFDLVGGGWVVVVVEGVVVQDQDQLAILSRTKRDPTKSTKKKNLCNQLLQQPNQKLQSCFLLELIGNQQYNLQKELIGSTGNIIVAGKSGETLAR
jgi:hypothetical protein